MTEKGMTEEQLAPGQELQQVESDLQEAVSLKEEVSLEEQVSEDEDHVIEHGDEEMGERSQEEANSGESEENLDELFSDAQIQGLIEALLFTSGEPIGLAKLKRVTNLPESRLGDILESIQMKFEIEDSGFRLVNAGGKYQFRTEQIFGPYIKRLKEEKPRRLSPAALETLAIVAYRQPIVKSDIEKIRGVDATPTIKTLIERRLIRIVGHQATVGQPALYGTTEGFLRIFGLGSLSELPSLRDLRELEADPGEVEEFDEEDSFDATEPEASEEEAELSDADEEDKVVQMPSAEVLEESEQEQSLAGNQ